MNERSRRRGFALVIVVLLMAIGSALMIVALNASLANTDSAQGETMQKRALVAAETEAWTTLHGLRSSALRSAPQGRFSETNRTFGDLTLIATVDKVDNSNVWIVATATIRWSAAVARHRLGLSAFIPSDTADLLLRLVPERGWAELF
ncbi:MAG: hypothetical protein ABI311_14940 [Gemmatimonadaceae bacterium]